jgi:mannose-1-phosphate guanylyltransferase
MLHPVIIAGGSGTRLWPLSREAYPKQFLNLTGGKGTMLQETIQRLDGLDHESPIVICNEAHRFIAGEQLRQIDVRHDGIILEPCGRNTAPAICLAALHALEKDKDARLLVLAADHVIEDEKEFRYVLSLAEKNMVDGQIVTFGIIPTDAATGYGYIHTNELAINEFNKVKSFIEKPSEKKAQQYFDDGSYLWNSGMFLFSAKDFLAELGKSRPDILNACEKAWKGKSNDLEFIRVDEKAFAACPSESIDYAVMEVTEHAYVMPLDVGWNDLGSWSSLSEVLDKDDSSNVIDGDVISFDSQNNYIHSRDKLVATLGVSDLIIVDTKDALLVTTKEQSQNIKKIVTAIKEAGRGEHEQHREVYRPWGKYDSMDEGARFQVKRITVNPGAKLSVQKHHHRAEHWVVVSGIAKVRVGEEEKLLAENQSVFIPVGEIHSLENPGKIPLELIEVQSGAYLGEDDIVRFEDLYGRA